MKPDPLQRSASWLAAAIALLLFGHLLWMAAYVHPYADDLSYAVAGIRTPLLERLVHEYTSWNGRYTSNLLVLRTPLVLGLQPGLVLYRLCAVFLFVLTWVGTFKLLRAWRPGGPTQHASAASLLALLLFTGAMPDLNEGFYWYTGAVTYQLANALSLFVLARWCRWERAGMQAVRWTWYAILSIQIVLIAGCNEVHMTMLLCGHVCWAMYLRLMHGRVPSVVWWMVGVSVFAALVVGLAPGNATREALFPHTHEPLRTATYAVAQTARFTLAWIFTTPLIPASILFVLWDRTTRSVQPRTIGPLERWSALALPFLVVLLAMVVTYWPTGLLGQYRTVNVALFAFLITWFRALTIWDRAIFFPRGWFSWGAVQPARAIGMLLVLVALGFGFSHYRVLHDLYSGSAAQYDWEMCARYALVEDAVAQGGTDTLVLAPIMPPSALHILPLDTSADHWLNRSLADYFGGGALPIKARSLPPER